MYSKQLHCFIVIIILASNNTLAIFLPSLGVTGVSKASRWNIPWLGLGVWCNGCPATGCDDDEAIIHGYCCGCAYSSDQLPVLCPHFLQCPLNMQGLCHDYEYMMRCCC